MGPGRLCRIPGALRPGLLAALGLWGPALAGATQPGTEPDRCQVFVAGLGENLAVEADRITLAFRQMLRGQPGLALVDPVDRPQAEPGSQQARLLDEARAGLRAAKRALGELEFETLLDQAQRARLAFEKMQGELHPLKRYKESILLVAVGHAMRGQLPAARAALRELLLLEPGLELPRQTYEGFVLRLVEEVRREVREAPRASLSVATTPGGADLYLDGVLRGRSPLSVDGLVEGSHWVIARLPGHRSWGQRVRVAPGAANHLEIRLEPGQAGGGIQRLIEAATRTVPEPGRQASVLRLGQALGLDWVWLCQVDNQREDTVLACSLFDFHHSRILHRDRLRLERESYDQEEELAGFARRFLRDGLGAMRQVRQAGDPLDGRTGTEDWDRDPVSRPRLREQPPAGAGPAGESRSGDPLDEKDGTEDW